MNNDSFDDFVNYMIKFIGIGLLLFGVVITAFWFAGVLSENTQLKEEVLQYETTYLHKYGYNTDVGNYHLVSMDGGRNWYAASGENGEVTIQGSADEIYPGLVENIEAWDRLTEYALENGPLGADGKLTPEEVEILEDVGFDVEEK